MNWFFLVRIGWLIEPANTIKTDHVFGPRRTRPRLHHVPASLILPSLLLQKINPYFQIRIMFKLLPLRRRTTDRRGSCCWQLPKRA
ncbi:hypothetical protein ACLKA6_015901 [Drosophila palustris]